MLSVRTLLHGAIDYAGLFPPAALAMTPAVRNYAAYRAGAERWLLGRFVVPAARLDDLEAAAAELLPGERGAPWRVSALVGGDVDAELACVDALNARRASLGGLVVDAVELRAPDPGALRRAARHVAARGPTPYAAEAYVEVPLDPDPAPFAAAAREVGVRLKARTGGIAPEAFPRPEALLRFIARCAEHDVPWKATAGLHHPLRGEHALTYEPGCARGTMFGFLSVFLAAALLRAGAPAADLLPLLEERDPTALTFDATGASWTGARGTLRADVAAIAAARERGIASFGSCSFEEPVADLRALDLLPL